MNDWLLLLGLCAVGKCLKKDEKPKVDYQALIDEGDRIVARAEKTVAELREKYKPKKSRLP